MISLHHKAIRHHKYKCIQKKGCASMKQSSVLHHYGLLAGEVKEEWVGEK